MNYNHVNKIVLIGEVATPMLPIQLAGKQVLFTYFDLKTQLHIRSGKGFVEEIDVHLVKVRGHLALLCLKNLMIGSLVYVEGRICSDKSFLEYRETATDCGSWIIAEQIRLLNQGDGSIETKTKNTANINFTQVTEEIPDVIDEEEEEESFLFSDRQLNDGSLFRKH